jgi:serine/threonine protein kinase
MEYADSGTLRSYLKEHFKNLTWDDKLNLALQLVDSVSCLHDEGIVHRDLVIYLLYSITNIMLFYAIIIHLFIYLKIAFQ